MATSPEPDVRIFEKVVDGETKTRRVTSESAAVAAQFDGFDEVKPTKAAAAKATTAASDKAANNAG